ncbi:G protein-regulated inducer of neurite outgrowth 3 [Discoglossus pictus]
MGTVPDPQGSARTLMVSTSMEEDHAESHKPHNANHQYKQETSNKNGNGISPLDSKPMGVCSYELNCIPSMKSLDSENVSENEPNKLMASLRTSSQTEMLSSSDTEPITNKEPQAIKESSQPNPTTNITPIHSDSMAVSPDLAHVTSPSKLLAIENNTMPKDNIFVEQLPQGKVELEVESSIKEEATDSNKAESVLPSTSQDVEIVNIKIEKLPNAAPLLSSTPVDKEAEINDSEEVTFSKSDECSQLSLGEESELNKPEEQETELYPLSRFKEMGTMTSHPENLSTQDAEVQAVVNVENKSVSTSPSILSAFLKINSPLFKERKDQVCFIYQGNPANAQMDRANFALQQQQLSQNHLAPKVCFQPPDAMGSQSLQRHTKSPPDMVRPAYQHPEMGRNPQLVYRNELDGQGLCIRDGHPMQQKPMPGASPMLMNVKPVYQINIENSNQPKVCQRPMDMYGDPSQFRVAHDMSNKSRLHHLSGTENIQLHNVRPDIEQTETLSVPGDNTDRKPFHFKITNEQGSTQAIITTDIKTPKKEERPTPLHVEVEVNSNMGATGGDEILEVLVTKEQEDSEHTKRSSSLSLQSRPASDYNPQLTPRLRKAREEKKEPVLITLSTSEQPKPTHGKKASSSTEGKKASSSTEAKSQAKQSKSVKDVVWDEQGMTWEVYGASMDPEALGIAIQNHLQRQIREHEKMIRAQLKQNRKSICSDSSGKKHKRRQHRVFQSLLKNFRRPNCCVRPPPTAVVD